MNVPRIKQFAARTGMAITGVLLAAVSFTEQSPMAGFAADAASADEESEKQSGDPSAHKHTNALIHETSPYLLQHAHNPVNWHPWGPAAFEKARKEDKPVFLSVGYSTCYWCHVMERESFEKDDVAAILNEHFIAIKVDREERPDIDEQFMLATQIVTGRGGWPNSIWLTPDGKPWMAGTYFPRDRFKAILARLDELWKTEREKVGQQADQLSAAIRRAGSLGTIVPGRPLSQELINQALTDITDSYDANHGGFGSQPKFPPHGYLRLLIDEYSRAKDDRVLNMVRGTLDAMLAGGVRDHLGGGFHRYSTDQHWLLPHFEKMLYDNAQLMRSYTDGYVLTGDERYREVVADIFDWLQREMTGPAGAFYSAIDSESEEEEGRFYVWPHAEIFEILGTDDGELFATVYGIEPEGNFVEEATGKRPGTNIPHLPQSIDAVAADRKQDSEQLRDRLRKMRGRLLAVRNQREFPHLDDKVLTSWNALMIESLTYAGRQLKEPRYIEAATKAADFVLDEMTDHGRLLRTYRANQAKQPGFLDDYAFLVSALIELHQTTDDDRWLAEARRLTDVMLADFEDEESGGFFFTTAQHSDILDRSKNLLGGGNIPSANGVAAEVLIRLDAIEATPKYRRAAHRTLSSLAGLMWRSPSSAESLVLAVAKGLQADLFSKDSTAGGSPASDSGKENAVAPASFEEPPVRGELWSSHTTVRPGQKIDVVVVLDIDEGWHLYGSNPDAGFLIESTVALKKNAAATIKKLTPPEGVRKRDATIDQELQLYEGRVLFSLALDVAADAVAGTTELAFEVTTQACDDKRCLKPETSTLTLPLTVDPNADEPPRPLPKVR